MQKLISCVILVALGVVAGCNESSVDAETLTSEAATVALGASNVVASVKAVPENAASEKTEALYNKSCIACHVSGAAGAPRTGDKAEWQRRIDAKGIEGLIDAAVNGVGSMPPTGLCSQCSRDDYRSLILFMAE